MPFCRASSWPRDRICTSCVSCTSRCVRHHQHHLGSPVNVLGLSSSGSPLLSFVYTQSLCTHRKSHDFNYQVHSNNSQNFNLAQTSLLNSRFIYSILRHLKFNIFKTEFLIFSSKYTPNLSLPHFNGTATLSIQLVRPQTLESHFNQLSFITYLSGMLLVLPSKCIQSGLLLNIPNTTILVSRL